MKQIDLSHPRVFHEEQWAEGYYQRNKSSIEKVGNRLAKCLKSNGFKNGKILDVGCGFASVPIEIAKQFPDTEIKGIDLGEPLLEIGRKLVKTNGLEDRIELSIGDAQSIQSEDNSFDLVINTFLLHIVEDPIQMLNEIERVAKPTGRVFITDLRRGFLANFAKKLRTAYTLNEASEIIKKSSIREGKYTKGPFWWDFSTET